MWIKNPKLLYGVNKVCYFENVSTKKNELKNVNLRVFKFFKPFKFVTIRPVCWKMESTQNADIETIRLKQWEIPWG